MKDLFCILKKIGSMTSMATRAYEMRIIHYKEKGHYRRQKSPVKVPKVAGTDNSGDASPVISRRYCLVAIDQFVAANDNSRRY